MHLVQHVFGSDDLVFVQADGHKLLAEATRGEGGQENIGVQDDLHETALKTSSSVRKPCASARGRVCLRKARNCSAATYRRNESRTMSLIGWFFCRLSF